MSPHRDGPAPSARYPWIAMAVIIVGAYPFVLNITVLGVALPSIAGDLQRPGAPEVDWVVTAYLVAVSAVQPGTGWMADQWGKRRLYVTALALFGLGTLVAGLAPTMEVLVVGRVVQGLGGGALMPIGLAIIYEVFEPTRRGLALGVWGVAIMAGPALGPPLGGWMTTAGSWRWIFWGMLPFVLLGFELGRRLLRDVGRLQPRPVDLPSWLLATLGLAAVIVAFRQAPSWGLTSLPTFLAWAIAVATLALFVRRGRRHPWPLLDLGMFSVRPFNVSMLVVGLLTVAQYARLTFLPVHLQVVQGLTPAEVGLLLAPGALGVAATMPLGGWLADRVGVRVPVMTGLAVMAVGMGLLARLRADATGGEIIAILVVSGLGTGLATMPNTLAAMSCLTDRLAPQASVVTSLNRQVTAAMGTAVLAAFVVAQLGAVVPEARDAAAVAAAHATYTGVFRVAFWCLVATTAAAILLPGRRVMREFQRARTLERMEAIS